MNEVRPLIIYWKIYHCERRLDSSAQSSLLVAFSKLLLLRSTLIPHSLLLRGSEKIDECHLAIIWTAGAWALLANIILAPCISTARCTFCRPPGRRRRPSWGRPSAPPPCRTCPPPSGSPARPRTSRRWWRPARSFSSCPREIPSAEICSRMHWGRSCG